MKKHVELVFYTVAWKRTSTVHVTLLFSCNWTLNLKKGLSFLWSYFVQTADTCTNISFSEYNTHTHTHIRESNRYANEPSHRFSFVCCVCVSVLLLKNRQYPPGIVNLVPAYAETSTPKRTCCTRLLILQPHLSAIRPPRAVAWTFSPPTIYYLYIQIPHAGGAVLLAVQPTNHPGYLLTNDVSCTHTHIEFSRRFKYSSSIVTAEANERQL